MLNKKRIATLLLAVAVAAGNVYAFRSETSAAPITPTVLVDGKLVVTDVPAQNVNGRVLIPYSAIGKAMGADVSWDDPTKQVTMILGESYVKLKVGSKTMTYGTVSYSSFGEPTFDTAYTKTLDVAPVNISSRVLVPVGAALDSLGATVNWIDVNKTVVVASPKDTKPSATPKPSASATATPSPTPGPTADTSYFQKVSSARAQQMFDERKQFMLVYFDSGRVNTAEYLLQIKEAAYESELKIYGVDASLESVNSLTLKFATDRIGTAFTQLAYPAVFYVESPTKVKVNSAPINKAQVKLEIEDFKYNTRPGATPSINYDQYLQPRTSGYELDNFYRNKLKHVVVYYDSKDVNNEYYMNIIKEAVYNYGTNNYSTYNNCIVYAIDAATPSGNSELRNEAYFYGNSAYSSYPKVFFLNPTTSSGTQAQTPDYRVLALPNNAADLTNKLVNFNLYNQYP